ncbi:hypothetical protein R3P38DRAFT_3167424 [Favolaschia claudopus]|uniref:Uncharacterized protein n=1 Tax=Favolaschia claudopus TaxID=2862362 RepID=A0AAW0EDE4_9AGAR
MTDEDASRLLPHRWLLIPPQLPQTQTQTARGRIMQVSYPSSCTPFRPNRFRRDPPGFDPLSQYPAPPSLPRLVYDAAQSSSRPNSSTRRPLIASGSLPAPLQLKSCRHMNPFKAYIHADSEKNHPSTSRRSIVSPDGGEMVGNETWPDKMRRRRRYATRTADAAQTKLEEDIYPHGEYVSDARGRCAHSSLYPHFPLRKYQAVSRPDSRPSQPPDPSREELPLSLNPTPLIRSIFRPVATQRASHPSPRPSPLHA